MANPAREARERFHVAHPGATVVGRTRNSIKHRIGAIVRDQRIWQQYALDVGIGPMHYGAGEDQEIDTAWQPSIASADGLGPADREMVKAGYNAYAKESLTSGRVIQYTHPESGEWVTFQPMALIWTNNIGQEQPISMPQDVAVSIDDDMLIWADGYGPGRTFQWQAQTARLAKRVEIGSLNDLPPVEQYILVGDGQNPAEPCLQLSFIFAHSNGVTPYINGLAWTGGGPQGGQRDTQGLVEFRLDATGEVLWWFNLPRSWDSDGEEKLGTFRFKKQGNSLYISHRVPLGWIEGTDGSGPRVWPITVDADIDEQVGASEDDAYTFFTTLNYVEGIIYIDYDGIDTHGYFRFTGLAAANGTTIDVAYMSPRASANVTGTSDLTLHAIDEDGTANFNTTQSELDGRGLTTASAPWNPGNWVSGTRYDSGSLVSIFQELADSGYLASGIAALRVDQDSQVVIRTPCSYDSNPSYAANLHIEWSVGATTLLPSSIATQEGFGAHTVAPGAVVILPSGLASLENFGSGQLNLHLAPSAIASLENFGSGQLNLKLEPPGLASLEGFGASQLNLHLSLSAIASLEGFGAPTVAGIQTLLPSSIAAQEGFGAHTVAPGVVLILPSSIPSAEDFGTALLKLILQTTGIATQEGFGAHVVLPGGVTLQPSGIVTQEGFGSLVVQPGAVVLLPTSIVSLESFGAALLELFITPTGVASLEGFGTTVVVPGVVVLEPSGIASSEAFGTAALVAVQLLLPTGIASTEGFGTPLVYLVTITLPLSQRWRLRAVIQDSAGVVKGHITA